LENEKNLLKLSDSDFVDIGDFEIAIAFESDL
jgi:hypothetical protein